MDNTKDNKAQNEDVTKTVKFKLNRPSSQEDKKNKASETKPKLSPTVSNDSKLPPEDVTKTVKFKLNRPSSQVDKKNKASEAKPKLSSSTDEAISRQIPKKTVVLKRGKTNTKVKKSTFAELPVQNNPSETVNPVVDSKQVEETLKLKRKNISSATLAVDCESSKEKTLTLRDRAAAKPKSSADGEISKTQTLKLRVPRPESSSDGEISKTQTLKRSVPESQPPLDSGINGKKTLKLRGSRQSPASAVSMTPEKKKVLFSTPITDKSSTSGFSDKNMEKSPLQVKDSSVQIEKKEKDSLKDESSISSELTLELDAALDALSSKTVNAEDNVLEKEGSSPVESEKPSAVGKTGKTPPLQVKDSSVQIEKKETDSLKDESSISSGLSLELDAAMDIQPSDTVSIEEETIKKEGSKPEKTPLTEKAKDTNDMIAEFQNKNQKEYGFAFVLVALLTLVGLIGFVYISFSSFSFLG